MGRQFQVVEISDDQFVELKEARERLPEPIDSPLDLLSTDIKGVHPLKFEQWERIIVFEPGVAYYIWKHVGTGLLFR